jgi:serine protease Do
MACLLVGAGPAADAAEVRLRDGRALVGDILKKRSEGVIVDLGFDVIQVPESWIIDVQEAEASEPAEKVLSEEDLFAVTELTETSIRKNVERFGEAVVMVNTPAGQGSGFVINKDGYVITNFHVVEGERKIEVTLFLPGVHGFDKVKKDKVRIIATNPFLDLALLRIEDLEGPLKTVYFGDSEDLRTGQEVFAVGNPMGLERSVSSGVVSSTNRNFDGQVYIQTTAAINPGNSGGPLFNLKGEVVGVTNMKIIGAAEGLGFAIPVRIVKDFLRNKDAFAFDKDSPNTGYHYLEPPRKPRSDP